MAQQHSMADIEKIRESLKAAPEISPAERKVSTQEAVESLLPEIDGLKGRGYTVEQIAELLSQDGLRIKGSALRSCLRRAAKGGSRRGRGMRKKQDARAQRAEVKIEKSADGSAVKQISVKVQTEEDESGKPKGTFIPREDSNDI